VVFAGPAIFNLEQQNVAVLVVRRSLNLSTRDPSLAAPNGTAALP
jgi:hypothetical protein